MQWIEINASVNAENVNEVASILGRYGQGGATVEEKPCGNDIREYSIKAYIPHSRTYKAVVREIRDSLKSLPFRIDIQESLLKPEAWFESLKKDFGVAKVGEKLIIKPSWEELPSNITGRLVIEIDPGAAFGTGLHPTTHMCLENLEKYLQPGMTIFDLGTGTGILAIAAAKLGSGSILAVDNDAVAVKTARQNVEANGVGSQIQVRRATLSQRTRNLHKNSFDMALANITARAISGLSGGLATILKPGGILIASGIHQEGLDEVLISLTLAGFTLESIGQDGQWHAVIARKEESLQANH